MSARVPNTVTILRFAVECSDVGGQPKSAYEWAMEVDMRPEEKRLE